MLICRRSGALLCASGFRRSCKRMAETAELATEEQRFAAMEKAPMG